MVNQTLIGMTPTPTAPDVASFRAQLRGELIARGDAGYDAARRVYNGMIDKHPALIARCVDAADVMSAVKFACDHGLVLAVRGGGHSGPGFGSCEDGLVIDLSPMRGVRVDPANRTVRVEGGCLLGDVDHATHAFGLAVPFGVFSTSGVGGLTLGGGTGYLSRKYGLSIDNLLSVDVVLADGRFTTASADENADLFWAVRGGGGNFGVVTSFLFQAHPVHTVYGGPMIWSLKQAPDVLKSWQDLLEHAPDDLYGFFAFLTVPPGPPFPEQYHLQKMCGVVWCYTGALDNAEAMFKPIRESIPPAIDFVGPMPYPALQSLFDPLLPPGIQMYWRADYFGELDDKAMALHAKYGARLPTMLSTMHIYPIDGAAARVANDATAWSYRDAKYVQVIVGMDPDPSNNERMIEWTKEYWLALHPYSMGGGYVNMNMEEGEDRVRSAYRDNYARLAQVKAQHDPQNLFCVNQNIRPTGSG